MVTVKITELDTVSEVNSGAYVIITQTDEGGNEIVRRAPQSLIRADVSGIEARLDELDETARGYGLVVSAGEPDGSVGNWGQIEE